MYSDIINGVIIMHFLRRFCFPLPQSLQVRRDYSILFVLLALQAPCISSSDCRKEILQRDLWCSRCSVKLRKEFIVLRAFVFARFLPADVTRPPERRNFTCLLNHDAKLYIYRVGHLVVGLGLAGVL